jgi:hypothetical protein
MVRVIFVLLLLLSSITAVEAQDLPTPAPVQLNSPTPLPIISGGSSSSQPIDTETPTPPGPAILEAKAEAGDVNVRAEADPNAQILGTIRAGTQYVVTGKYYLWYQIRFDAQPRGLGYVFGDLVNVIGDQTLIVDLSIQPLATTDANVLGATETWAAITLTPGIELTATANASVLQGPIPAGAAITVVEGQVVANPNEPRAILPTFTYPPQVAQLSTQTQLIPPSPTPAITPLGDIGNNGLPPIVPIALLGVCGVLGLLISALRR